MCLNLVCAKFMTYNKAIAFIVPQLLPFLLKVRQEPRDQSYTYTETYVFVPERDIPILTNHCEEFIRFLEENRELITDTKIFGLDDLQPE